VYILCGVVVSVDAIVNSTAPIGLCKMSTTAQQNVQRVHGSLTADDLSARLFDVCKNLRRAMDLYHQLETAAQNNPHQREQINQRSVVIRSIIQEYAQRRRMLESEVERETGTRACAVVSDIRTSISGCVKVLLGFTHVCKILLPCLASSSSASRVHIPENWHRAHAQCTSARAVLDGFSTSSGPLHRVNMSAHQSYSTCVNISQI
jgi:hypothetical protein